MSTETAREKSEREGRDWDVAFVAAGFARDANDAAQFRDLLWNLWEDGKTHLPPTVRFSLERLKAFPQATKATFSAGPRVVVDDEGVAWPVDPVPEGCR